MHPPSHLFRSSRSSSHQSSLRDSADFSSLAGSSTDRPSSEQVLALVPHPSDIPHTPEPLEEEFEEISYDELRLSLCPADPAHFAPVFGESVHSLCYGSIVMGVGMQTTNGRIGDLSSRALVRPSHD